MESCDFTPTYTVYNLRHSTAVGYVRRLLHYLIHIPSQQVSQLQDQDDPSKDSQLVRQRGVAKRILKRMQIFTEAGNLKPNEI